jgi:ABC-2 type transport system permease protein
MTAIRHTWYISLRDLRNLARQPWWIAISLAQPLVYLFLYSALFRKVAEIPGFEAGSYIDFLTPGIVILTALFSGGFAGMAIINDLDQGVIDRFLATPVSRAALIVGRLLQGAIVVTIQCLIIIGLSLTIGANFPGGVAGVFILVAVAVLLGSAVGALSIALALVVRREESVIGAVQMLLLPMTFLASVFMARELMPGWVQDIASFNPVDWAALAGREAVSADVDWTLVFSHGAYLVVFALVSAWIATSGFRAYQRSV